MGKLTLFNSGRDLFEQVCASDNLHRAFNDVKSNKGAPGVDRVTIEAFEVNLHKEIETLSKELAEWRYMPRPAKRVEIDKPGGGVRKLGIPCVRDRVVQACLKAVLEPIFEPKFSPTSFGFRPGRKQRDAVETARTFIEAGREWVVDLDLEKFYDTISHDRLIFCLGREVADKRILRLVGIILRSGVLIGSRRHPTTEGAPQGSPLSPLLSNVILDDLDKELERRGIRFVRWADDCNIFLGSEKAAVRVMESISKYIEKRLKLRVNRLKSQVARASQISFLGLTIVAGTIAISKKSMAKAMRKTVELVRTNSPEPVEKTLERVNEWYVGWANYFSMGQYPIQFRMVEGHVRRRLRARFVRQSKRRKHLAKRLVKRGLKKKRAHKHAYSNKGPWKLSGPVMQMAYGVSWFTDEKNQEIASDKALPHWFSVQKRIPLA